MNSYQQPDFNSPKVISICKQYQIRELRLIEPLKDRSYRPDQPLDLLAEFAGAKSTLHVGNAGKELAIALGKKVSLQNIEEMTRHARFSAISGSKVVFT